jgi:hypothetical protein
MEWQSHIEDEGEDLKSQRMDFEEKFALSTDRKAILNELVPGSVKFVYWNAIYRLQEIQEKNALNQLKKNEKEMDEAIFQLNQLGCFHKPKRIAYRRKILELEILYRLQEPPSKIKVKGKYYYFL